MNSAALALITSILTDLSCFQWEDDHVLFLEASGLRARFENIRDLRAAGMNVYHAKGFTFLASILIDEAKGLTADPSLLRRVKESGILYNHTSIPWRVRAAIVA